MKCKSKFEKLIDEHLGKICLKNVDPHYSPSMALGLYIEEVIHDSKENIIYREISKSKNSQEYKDIISFFHLGHGIVAFEPWKEGMTYHIEKDRVYKEYEIKYNLYKIHSGAFNQMRKCIFSQHKHTTTVTPVFTLWIERDNELILKDYGIDPERMDRGFPFIPSIFKELGESFKKRG